MDAIDRRLLDEFQHDLPLVPDPYAAIGRELGIGAAEVITRLDRLCRDGCVSRIGAVIKPGCAGASTLAAMAVPGDGLERVAALVSGYAEVNHNYQREHRLNLWFVVTAASREDVDRVLADICRRSGIEVLDLPMLEDFHINLGFGLQWT